MAITRQQFGEQLVDHVPNITLSANILSSDTAIPCNDTANLPTEGMFRVHLGTELLIIQSNNTANNTLTAHSAGRGAENTSAANHNEGAELFFPATPELLAKLLLERSKSAGFSQSSSIEAVPNNRIQDATGNILTVSDFTWVNQGTATAVDSSSGGIILTTQCEAAWQHRGLVISQPTPPFRVRLKVRFGPGYYPWDATNGSVISAGFRQSGTGELKMIGVRMGQNVAVWKWDSPTAYNSTLDATAGGTFCDDALWLQFEDDGASHKFYASHDGNSWTRDNASFWQESNTTFLTADQIGFFVNSTDGENDQMYHIESFVIEEE